jgi:tetratricopeptide (TPR) repeat protein
MFSRGPHDEGLLRLCQNATIHASCDTENRLESSANDHDCFALATHSATAQQIQCDRLVEINNMACSLYQSGSIDESLEKLLMLVTVIHCLAPSSCDDTTTQHHPSLLATILRNIAQVYFVKEKYVEALKFSKEAVASNTLEDDELSACLWFNLGFLLWHVEKSFEGAKCALSRSLHILTKLRTTSYLPAPTKLDRYIVSAQSHLLLIQEQREGQGRLNSVSLLRMLIAKQASLGFEHESVANTLATLGSFYMRHRNFESAVHFLLATLSLQQSLHFSETDQLRTLTQLGQCLQRLGRDVEAMSAFREALRLKSKSIMREDPQVQALFATALYNIGMIQSCQGDRNDQQRRMRALHSFKLCLDLRRKALGPESPGVASTLHNIGILLLEDGQVANSMKCFQESLQIRRKVYGSKHHEVATSLRHIGKINHNLGEYDESLRLHLEALWILRQSPRHSSDYLMEVLVGLGQAQHANGFLDQALKSYEEASKLIRERKDKGYRNASHHMVRILNIMGGLALDMADVDSANKFFEEAATLSGKKHAAVPSHVPPCAAAA